MSPGGRVAGSALQSMSFPVYSHAFTWTGASGIVDIGTLGGVESHAAGVNDAGQVVGRSLIPSGAMHAFSWTPGGGMLDLGTLGGTSSAATGVNAGGTVVGWSDTGDGATHAFVWTQTGGMTDIGTLVGAAAYSAAEAISDSGEVVGTSASLSGRRQAFSWKLADGMTEIDGPVADTSALAVSSTGRIVGSSGGIAFTWTLADGLTLLPGPGGGSSVAYGVNATGRIVGQSMTPSGEQHATIWRASETAPIAPARPSVVLDPQNRYIQDTTGSPLVTNGTDLTVTGLAEPSSVVTFFVERPGSASWTFGRSDAWGRYSVPFHAAEDGAYALSATVTSSTGQTSGRGPALTVVVDRTGPALNIIGPPGGVYDLASPPTRPRYAPTDEHFVDGGSEVWEPAHTTTGIGTYTYLASAWDRFGNTSFEKRTYTVVYGSTFRGPDPAIASTHRAGATIPIRFGLLRAGAPITGALAALWVAKGSVAAPTTGTVSDLTRFRYDAASQRYAYDLDTSRAFANPDGSSIASFSAGPYTLTIALDDGSTHALHIVLTAGRLVIGKPATTPRRLVAGARIHVTFIVRDVTGHLVNTGKLALNPRIGGRLVAHRESLRRGRAEVSLLLPPGSRGKRLVISVTCKAGGLAGRRVVGFAIH